MIKIMNKIFASVVTVLSFINKYFKSMIFLLIIYLIFLSGKTDSINSANLVQINLVGGINSSDEIVLKLDEATANNFIKGVLLNIDSPGGELSPSTEISMAVQRLREKKPVLVYVSGTMTSGSYLGGAYATKIYSNPGSLIGSIGVIMQGANIANLLKKIGISEQIISAGEYKQAGTFTREWTKDEKAELQNLVNKSYEFFIKTVANARGLNIADSDKWANARVFMAQDAQKVGLIDKVSNYFDAKKEIERLSGVSKPLWYKQPAYEKFVNNLPRKMSSFIADSLMAKIK